MATAPVDGDVKTSITPLLKRLWHESPSTKPTADEIAAALALIFTNSLSEVQTGALLTCLHFTDQDRQADVLAKCSKAMRDFSTGIDVQGLENLLKERGRKEGGYYGGLVCSSSQFQSPPSTKDCNAFLSAPRLTGTAVRHSRYRR
jgi:anthranilate phosphoribosyltransferase